MKELEDSLKEVENKKKKSLNANSEKIVYVGLLITYLILPILVFTFINIENIY